MQWHFEDITLLIHSIPHALHDLMQHEDAEMVKKTVATLSAIKPTSVSPLISIEKTLDPMAQRSAQNIGLLLHDYLNQLPSFDLSHAESKKLLDHWREIMITQPQRLSVAQQSHWHSESSKSFWHEKIASHHADLGITVESFPDAWDDWQRASGIGHNIGSVKQLPAMKQKQWQDLVIRARLHKETVALWNEG